ncbi:MAG: hypothetical protein RL417_1310 [Pseudomonadota bacterium]
MARESPFIKPFLCPACGAPQTIRALGKTIEYSCTSCGSLIDITAEPFSVLAAAANARAHEPKIPLGQRGMLQGIAFECIGFMIRTDPSLQYPWEEYLLFNPYHGFRWLITMNGHWNFVTPVFGLSETPEEDVLTYEGRTYSIFLRDSAIVQYVQGEFYWQVKVGDRVNVREYISPPFTLSVEVDENEQNFAHAEYLQHSEVETAFALEPKSLPQPSGIFPNQPSPHLHNRFFYVIGTLVVLPLLFVIHFMLQRPPEPVTAVSGTAFPGTSPSPLTTETVEFLDHGNLGFLLQSPVLNSWVDAEIGIVNADTGATTETSVGVSYFHGLESGERWSEGSTTSAVTVGDIPSGRYYFTVQATNGASPSQKAPQPFSLSIRRHVSYLSNLFLAIVVACLPLALNLLRGISFESRRWNNSTETNSG